MAAYSIYKSLSAVQNLQKCNNTHFLVFLYAMAYVFALSL